MCYHDETCSRYLARSPELTFIVLARPLERGIPDNDDGPELQLTDGDIRTLPLIGDVNLFFKHQPDDPEFEIECEVMIAGAYSAMPPLPSPRALKELSCRARVPRTAPRTCGPRASPVLCV